VQFQLILFVSNKQVNLCHTFNVITITTFGVHLTVRKKYSIVFLLLIGISCNGPDGVENVIGKVKSPQYDTNVYSAKIDSLGIESDLDLELVDSNYRDEFLNNVKGIERQYGPQWDFCTCIVKNDSINKAFKNSGLSDADFSNLIVRFDQIEKRCKAFLVQNPQNTPEERRKHEEKVRLCLEQQEPHSY
jgi:hypothetical protein